MLARILDNIIRSGQYEVEDIQNKLDVFWSKNRLTDEEYFMLCDLMIEFPPIVVE